LGTWVALGIKNYLVGKLPGYLMATWVPDGSPNGCTNLSKYQIRDKTS